MIVIWRGKGIFGLIPLIGIPTIALIAAVLLIENQHGIAKHLPFFTERVAGFLLLIAMLGGWFGGGFVCFLLGRRWNQHENFHHVYFIPIQYLGLASCLACLAAVLMFVVLAINALVQRAN